MRFQEIAGTSAAVADTTARRSKIERLSACLARLRPAEVRVAVPYLAGEVPGGTVGVGWAALRDLPPAAGDARLELLEVHDALERIRATTGKGSQAARRAILREVFARATEPERRFLTGLLLREIRQGALEGVMVEAVARAAGVAGSEVRRAQMLAGDLGAVAEAAIAGGTAGLAGFRLALLRPIQPMLAQTAETLDDAFERIAPAAVEWKLDGARLQVHREDGAIRAFTRNLADVTARVPEIVRVAAALPVRSIVLDGEAIALRPDGRPRPFQETMSRFGSRLDVERLAATRPLTPFFFDCLHLDGEDLIDRPLRERFARLTERVPGPHRVPRAEAASAQAGRAVLEDALQRGHEGVMVKALGSPYEAGRRGAAWLKVKPAHTLDLVVLAAEWGHGRRRGWLSNLHLGARDPQNGGFVMLGKTFKGMTDDMLTWQTEHLLGLETGRDRFTVHVRPELVVEVAFDGVQASPRYPGGLALRFARVKGYRPDKGPADADAIDAVRAIHLRSAIERDLPGSSRSAPDHRPEDD